MAVEIEREEVLGLLAESAQLVEVLPAEEFADEHLPGAVNIPLRELGTRGPASSTGRVRSSSTATTTSET